LAFIPRRLIRPFASRDEGSIYQIVSIWSGDKAGQRHQESGGEAHQISLEHIHMFSLTASAFLIIVLSMPFNGSTPYGKN
jgi:hypothetical protein